MLDERLTSLLIPWNLENVDEVVYKEHGCVKTVGTVFVVPPSDEELIQAFEKKHKGRNLTVGARALCKHYQRVEGKHPFWTFPTGSEFEKSKSVRKHLDDMLQNSVWKNVHKLSGDTTVYETRNAQGYGMRWTLSGESISFRGYLEPETKIKEKPSMSTPTISG
jgi:hypothetical protein